MQLQLSKKHQFDSKNDETHAGNMSICNSRADETSIGRKSLLSGSSGLTEFYRRQKCIFSKIISIRHLFGLDVQ
jgi:hypothetical protein